MDEQAINADQRRYNRMTKETLIALRIDAELAERLEQLEAKTGLNKSALIRQLIRNATIEPVQLQTTASTAAAIGK